MDTYSSPIFDQSFIDEITEEQHKLFQELETEALTAPEYRAVIGVLLQTITHVARAPKRASRGACITSASEKISIRLPHWVLDHFREEAERTGCRYQTLISQALMDHARA